MVPILCNCLEAFLTFVACPLQLYLCFPPTHPLCSAMKSHIKSKSLYTPGPFWQHFSVKLRHCLCGGIAPADKRRAFSPARGLPVTFAPRRGKERTTGKESIAFAVPQAILTGVALNGEENCAICHFLL